MPLMVVGRPLEGLQPDAIHAAHIARIIDQLSLATSKADEILVALQHWKAGNVETLATEQSWTSRAG